MSCESIEHSELSKLTSQNAHKLDFHAAFFALARDVIACHRAK